MTATTNLISPIPNPPLMQRTDGSTENSFKSPPAKGFAQLMQPSDSINISLTPPPIVALPFYENVSFLVAIITLLGVWISLKAAAGRTRQELAASESRMRTELDHAATQASIEREQSREQANSDRKHDAEEAHRERITTARRSAYLDAIAELVKTQVFLGSLAKRDISKLDISAELGGLFVALAKVTLLAEMKTIRQSRSLVSLLNQILLRSIGKVMPLTVLSKSASVHDEFYAATQLEIKRILASMTHHNETLRNDRIGFEALQRSFETQQIAAKHHSSESIKANIALADGQKKYGFDLMSDMKIVADQLDELTHLIRSELDLETDIEELKRLTLVAQVEAEKAVREFIATVNEIQKAAVA